MFRSLVLIVFAMALVMVANQQVLLGQSGVPLDLSSKLVLIILSGCLFGLAIRGLVGPTSVWVVHHQSGFGQSLWLGVFRPAEDAGRAIRRYLESCGRSTEYEEFMHEEVCGNVFLSRGEE